MINISNITFHDAFITEVQIMTLDNHFDYVSLTLEALEFRERYNADKIKLIFDGCYKARLDLQMWILGKDTIRNCYCKKESDLLNQVDVLISKGLLPNNSKFKHFSIELNTSGSTIDILAKSAKINLVKS